VYALKKITVGIDIGSTTSKAVVLVNGQIASSFIGSNTINPTKTAHMVYQRALSAAGAADHQVAYIVGTGHGKAKVDFAHENVSEIFCHARGARHLVPEARTIIDIGGQDAKAISLDKSGEVREFAVNGKCAAGTGKYLDFMAKSMGMKIRDMVLLHFEKGPPAMISSLCGVFAESEVVNMINEDIPLPSIIKGLHKSVANRLNALALRVGVEKEIVATGGVAKNRGVVETLEESLRHEFAVFPAEVDPQIVGALGAAVIGSEKAY
jgi:(R)-2-hydroxyacyl-CoA dehydratese activating ATPase